MNRTPRAAALLALTFARAAASGDAAGVLPVEPKAPPDLTSAATVSVGGVASAWKQKEIVVNASKAAAKYPGAGGLCEFAVSYSIRNQGLAPTGAFQASWTSDSPNVAKKSFPSLNGGAQAIGTVLVTFRSGAQALGLHLDPANVVHEINEKNNDFGVRVRVVGSCDPAN